MKRRNIIKTLPVGDKRDPYGYEVRYIDFSSVWSRDGGPEVSSRFFLQESNAKTHALELGKQNG